MVAWQERFEWMIAIYVLCSVEMWYLFYPFIATLTIRAVTCHHLTVLKIKLMSDGMIVRCLLATFHCVIVVAVDFNYMCPIQQSFV